MHTFWQLQWTDKSILGSRHVETCCWMLPTHWCQHLGRSVCIEQSELWLSRCAVPAVEWTDVCLKPFKMNFITHIFHKLSHVRSCPAGLCANMQGGFDGLHDGQVKQAKILHSNGNKTNSTTQDRAGFCVNSDSASQYLLTDYTWE